MYEIDACMPTLASLRELQPKANAVSASVKVIPPCARPWPFDHRWPDDQRAARVPHPRLVEHDTERLRREVARQHRLAQARASASPVNSSTLTRAACASR